VICIAVLLPLAGGYLSDLRAEFPVLQFVMLRVAKRFQKSDAVCLCARCIRLLSEVNWRRIVTGEAGNASVVAFFARLV
jgi:hypothetical protein